MSHYIRLPRKKGSALHRINSRLTENNQLAYGKYIVAKNDNQNWRSEIIKMHGRIFRGFFYARNLLHCATMAGHSAEPSGSLLALMSSTPTLFGLSPFYWRGRKTVFKFIKETV